MSEGFMKSALDRAMERADKINVPPEKLKEMEYRSQGERIAAEFLRIPGYDLDSALRNNYDAESKKHISKVVESQLLHNLILPRKEADIAGNEKIFEGLNLLKKNKDALKQAKEQLTNLSNYYAQARKQNYEQLKADVKQAMSQTIQQRTGVAAEMSFSVEQTPEFQENWRQLSGRLDAEYDKALTQLKDQIASIV